MKPQLRFFFAFIIVLFAVFSQRPATAYPDPPPPCPWDPKYVQVPNPGVPPPDFFSVALTPSAAFASYSSEPATINYVTKKRLIVSVVPGTKVKRCDHSQEAPWTAAITAVDWQSSGVSPSSGTCPQDCPYTGEFTPLFSGTVPVTFSAHLTTFDPVWPDPIVVNHQTTIEVLEQQRIAHWSFDGSMIGDEGQQPLSANNVQMVSGWNGKELVVDNALPPRVSYKALEDATRPNLTRNQGTIRFWFKPNWYSQQPGLGPITLIEATDAQGTMLAIRITSSGNTVELSSRHPCTGSSSVKLTSGQLSWAVGRWHQVAITYSANSSQLYVDGLPVGSPGGGVETSPRAATTFYFGNSESGLEKAKGHFDELEIFNFPLEDPTILADYTAVLETDSDDDGLTNLEEVQDTLTNPYNPDTDGDGSGDLPDCFPLDANRWTCGNPSDTTPPILELLEPINATDATPF